MNTKYITEPGSISNLTINGSGTLKSIGCVINLPKPTDVFEVKKQFVISNCNEPLHIRCGTVICEGEFITSGTWGDGIKHHENSTLFLQKYEINNPIIRHIPKRGQKQPEYHVDRYLQAYSRSGCTNVGNITIKELYGTFVDPNDQAFMFSEPNDFYHDIEIGSEVIDVIMEYGYFVRATNGTRFKIGGGFSNLRNSKGQQPLIHIADKHNPIKPTPYESHDINIAASLYHPRNVIPFEENNILVSKANLLGIDVNKLRSLLS